MSPLKTVTESPPAQKALSLMEEFKTFAFKGNAIELAVGVIIGAAFGRVVDSLVKNVLMPLLNLLLPGEQSYTEWKLVIGQKEVPYGLFLGELVNFLIIALALFLVVVKFLGWVVRFRQEEAPPAPPKEEALLTEIRDLLKQQTQQANQTKA